MKYKEKNVNEDTKEIRNLLIIALIISALAVGLYFFTDKVLMKDNSETDTSDVEFDYSICTIGTMLNRPYNEYYVFAYDSTDENASNYKALVTNYETKDGAKKVYTIDLHEKTNADFVAETSNLKVSNISDLKIKDDALFLIKDGKITKVYETKAKYESVLKID